ncbi:MAG TPA: response regulator [Nitrospina sp.]|nr:response regulator [Nitrospinota bacterium]MBV52219.1 response regulator [Nitrospinota bacterium]HAX46040.1 response regulator [Nitrospina sp.]
MKINEKSPVLKSMKKLFRVLILDDSREVSERLANMLLELDGIEIVGQAENSKTAMAMNRELNPHAVVLDTRLPDETGIEVLKEIKKLNFDTKVIIFSNHSFPQYREKCLALGADFYFDKATEFEQVSRTIAQWVFGYSGTEMKP